MFYSKGFKITTVWKCFIFFFCSFMNEDKKIGMPTECFRVSNDYKEGLHMTFALSQL
jgi:hypothetical protein